jgi:hypothetical protein
MYEYAISDGEGTLLAYGVIVSFIDDDDGAISVRSERIWKSVPLSRRSMVIIAPCPDDCETGR